MGNGTKDKGVEDNSWKRADERMQIWNDVLVLPLSPLIPKIQCDLGLRAIQEGWVESSERGFHLSFR